MKVFGSNDADLGFGLTWITTVMRFVTLVQYAVLINGQVGDIFHPTRGIRQGYHIAPYPFILCAGGLSALIDSANQRGNIRGIRVLGAVHHFTTYFFLMIAFFLVDKRCRSGLIYKYC